ncbi:MAG: hypothetical protein ABFS21_06805 [Actinomycetota bacterium]
MKSRMLLLVVLALVFASCSSSSEETTTTATTAPTTTTTTTTPTTTTTTTTTAPTSEPVVPTFPEYRIAERVVSPETGDTVVLLLDPASYTTLTDLDLYEVIADAVDRFPPIFEAHVVDSAAAADAVLVEEPDEAQLASLDEHYFARLEDGFRIVYVGVFEAAETAVLGS